MNECFLISIFRGLQISKGQWEVFRLSQFPGHNSIWTISVDLQEDKRTFSCKSHNLDAPRSFFLNLWGFVVIWAQAYVFYSVFKVLK